MLKKFPILYLALSLTPLLTAQDNLPTPPVPAPASMDVTAPPAATVPQSQIVTAAVPAETQPADISRVKFYEAEALRLLVSPKMRIFAAEQTSDPELMEKIALAQAMDLLIYDGMRLVRTKGVIMGDRSIDDLTVYVVVKNFSVSATQARAWLVASRLMQMCNFKSDGVVFFALKDELLRASAWLRGQISQKLGPEAAQKIMPNLCATLDHEAMNPSGACLRDKNTR